MTNLNVLIVVLVVQVVGVLVLVGQVVGLAVWDQVELEGV